MAQGVLKLLSDAGIGVRSSGRDYRPAVDLPGVETKTLKPQNLIEMLAVGSRDLGFAGADWVEEKQVEVCELLDTELDPVTIVAAAPIGLAEAGGTLPTGPLRVASEYERITRRWIKNRGIEARLIRSYGATEVFPPEDADVIVDCRASGETLRANNLEVLDVCATSSTRLFASPLALERRETRLQIEDITLVLESVLEARRRVMLEVNAPADRLDSIVDLLPSMRQPTVASLFGGTGYAIKAAIPRESVTALIPALKSAGGTDLVITQLNQIVP